jgi:hypothetical protein
VQAPQEVLQEQAQALLQARTLLQAQVLQARTLLQAQVLPRTSVLPGCLLLRTKIRSMGKLEPLGPLGLLPRQLRLQWLRECVR